jgi:hypothetical protein
MRHTVVAVSKPTVLLAGIGEWILNERTLTSNGTLYGGERFAVWNPIHVGA